MVEKVKKLSKDTQRTLKNLYEILVLAAKAAGGIKLVLLPYVHSNVAKLPIWQFIGALLLASVAYRLLVLHNKEN